MIAKYDIHLLIKDSWILYERVELPSLHLFSIDACVCVIWAVKCIYQNWCSYFRGIVGSKLHYQKGMSTIIINTPTLQNDKGS